MHTDCVVYTGTFQFNRPLEVVGSKDGSVLIGDFVVLPTTPSPPPPPPSSYTTELLLSNPYLRGLPHGENVTIQFKDGIASYVGEMQQGRISDSGTYRYYPSGDDNDNAEKEVDNNNNKMRDPNSFVVIK